MHVIFYNLLPYFLVSSLVVSCEYFLISVMYLYVEVLSPWVSRAKDFPQFVITLVQSHGKIRELVELQKKDLFQFTA